MSRIQITHIHTVWNKLFFLTKYLFKGSTIQSIITWTVISGTTQLLKLEQRATTVISAIERYGKK